MPERFSNFPKKREPLSSEYQKIYKQHFSENRQASTRATGLSSRMEAWMHRQVAEDVAACSGCARTLELGAGGLNHLDYEPDVKDYDVVEPDQDLLHASELKARVGHIYKDIFDVPRQETYQRITSIAVLEHLEELPRVIARCGLMLADDGSFRAGIPNEGTLLWTLGYRLTTGLEFWMRYHLDYNVLMRYEHVNTADEIEEVLRYFFDDVQCRVFGLSRALAFYRVLICRRADKEKCRAYLEIE